MGSIAKTALNVLTIVALTGALSAGSAEATFPGKPGPIVYAKYRDVGEIVGESEQLHPEGGLFSHGPRIEEASQQLTTDASDGAPAFSPNGQLIAFASTRGQAGLSRRSQLYLMHRDGSGLRQLTDGLSGASGPSFSPDGRRLVFSGRGGHLFLLTIASGTMHQLTFGHNRGGEAVFTPSGRRILYVSGRKENGSRDKSDIWAVGSDGRNARVLVDGPGAELGPEVSPNGRRIAYVTQQSPYYGYGELQIADATGRLLRSLDQRRGPECRPCYASPSWAPDGRHLVATEVGDNVGSTALIVMRPDGTHRRSFDEGTVSTDGAGQHLSSPTWGPAPG